MSGERVVRDSSSILTPPSPRSPLRDESPSPLQGEGKSQAASRHRIAGSAHGASAASA
jgi:hypothetical protein